MAAGQSGQFVPFSEDQVVDAYCFSEDGGVSAADPTNLDLGGLGIKVFFKLEDVASLLRSDAMRSHAVVYRLFKGGNEAKTALAFQSNGACVAAVVLADGTFGIAMRALVPWDDHQLSAEHMMHVCDFMLLLHVHGYTHSDLIPHTGNPRGNVAFDGDRAVLIDYDSVMRNDVRGRNGGDPCRSAIEGMYQLLDMARVRSSLLRIERRGRSVRSARAGGAKTNTTAPVCMYAQLQAVTSTFVDSRKAHGRHATSSFMLYQLLVLTYSSCAYILMQSTPSARTHTHTHTHEEDDLQYVKRMNTMFTNLLFNTNSLWWTGQLFSIGFARITMRSPRRNSRGSSLMQYSWDAHSPRMVGRYSEPLAFYLRALCNASILLGRVAFSDDDMGAEPTITITSTPDSVDATFAPMQTESDED